MTNNARRDNPVSPLGLDPIAMYLSDRYFDIADKYPDIAKSDHYWALGVQCYHTALEGNRKDD